MTSSIRLETYRRVRDAVENIKQLASDVDEHLGRYQIYGHAEELADAIAQAESLGSLIEHLALELRRCGPEQQPSRRGTRGAAAAFVSSRINSWVSVMIRSAHWALPATGAMALLAAPVSVAGSPDEFIGAPVYASDGIEVGRVADVSTTEGRIDAIRMKKGTLLGLGERLVVIPQPAFMISPGSIVLPDLRAEDVDFLPDSSSTMKHRQEDR